MKKLILLLFFPIILLAQNTTKGTIISGPAAARPTCSATFNATTANTGDIYNDSDDVNIWKCSGGSWSVLGGGLTGVQNNGVTSTPEPFINFLSPLTVTTNSGNTSNDITCSIMVLAGAGHASGCVGDPGAVAHSPAYYWGDNATFNALPGGLANAAIKPDPSSSILYVAGICSTGIACSDSNDGLSIGSAMLTIYHAICSLPTGNCTTQTAGQGTVYVLGNSNNANLVNANPTSGCGIWIMGPSDPNFASPPTCWLKEPFGYTGLAIIGIPNATQGPNGHNPRVNILAGSHLDNYHPAFWISASQNSIKIQNIFAYANSGQQGRPVIVGECSGTSGSPGNRTGTCQSSTMVWDNDSFQADTTSGSSGPCTDITGQSLWLWFRDYGCGGVGYLATGGYLANNAAGMLIDGTGGQVQVVDSNFGLGGIKVTGGAGLYANNVTEEGDFVHSIPPVVWFSATVGGTGDAQLSNIQLADPGAQTVAIENDGGGTITVSNTSAGSVQGAAVVLNEDGSKLEQLVNSPALQGQSGFLNGYAVGHTNVARNIAGLVPARLTNKASTSSAIWVITNNAGVNTLTQGITDKFGGTGAATASSTNATNEKLYMAGNCTINYTPATGDWIVGGGFIETNIVSLNSPIAIDDCGASFPVNAFTSTVLQLPQTLGDGWWSFVSVAKKVSDNLTGARHIDISSIFLSGSPVTVFAPVLYVIPAGTMTDDEVAEFVQSMGAQDTKCIIGSICNITGHPISADVFTERATVAPTGTSGITQDYMDSTTNWPSFKPNGNTAYSTAGFLASAPVDQDCVKWLVSGGVKTLGDAGAACGSGGGGSGTITASLLNSFTYYSGAGTSTTVNGVNGLTAPIGVFGFLGSIPQAGNLAGTPVQLLAGISGRTSTVASGTTANIINTDRAHRVKHTNAGATTISLPGAGTTDFASNYCYKEKVEGTGASDTITPVAGTINGSASLTMLQGQAALVCSYDNSNYEADVLEVGGIIAGTNITIARTDFGGMTISSTAGGGTVTHTAGALTSGQLVIGNAAADITVGDLSGDVTTAGSTVATVPKVHGVAYPASPSTNTVPVVTGANTITYEAVPAAALVGSGATTVNGQTCTLGSTCNVNVGSTAHGVAVNEGNGAAIASTSVGATNMLFVGVSSADPIFNDWTDVSATGYAGTATGLVNVLAACPTNAATALTTGMISRFLPNLANTTTTPTYNLCSLGAKTITKHGTAVLAVNDLTTIAPATVQYDGTEWVLQNPDTERGSGAVAVSGLLAASASNQIGNGNFPQEQDWAQTTNSQAAQTFGETSAATNGTVTSNLALQSELALTTLPGSTATPLNILQGSNTSSVAFPALQVKTTWNNASTIFQGIVFSLVNTASSANSCILCLYGGAGVTSEFSVNTAGLVTSAGGYRNASSAYSANAIGSGMIFQGGTPTSAVTGLGGNGTLTGGTSSQTTGTPASGSALVLGAPESGATGTTTGGSALINSGATTSATGNPGVSELANQYLGTGFTAYKTVCMSSTGFTVASCTTTSSAWGAYVGVAMGAGSPVPVVEHGQVPLIATAAVTVGHTACLSAVTADEITDSTGTAPCASGPTFVVVAVAGVVRVLDSTGLTTAGVTLSTTQPLVRLP